MSKFLLLVFCGLMLALSAAAAPANCLDDFPAVPLNFLTDPNNPVFQDGCLVQDKLFSNFTYTQGDAANPDASQVLVIFALTPGPNPPAGDLHAIQFQSSVVNWTMPFGVSYNISVFGAPPGTSIVEAFFDLSVAGGGSVAAGTKTLVGNDTYTINAAVGGPGTSAINYETSLGVTVAVNPNGEEVSSIVDSYTQGMIPEPGTWAMLGGGLVLLGALRRRKG